MAHGIILDWGGTLNSLRDPVAFLVSLRERHPDSLLILYAGTRLRDIEAECPGAVQLFDIYIEKPLLIGETLAGLGRPPLESASIADDDLFLRTALGRQFRDIPCQLVEPKDLLRLLDAAQPGEGNVSER